MTPTKEDVLKVMRSSCNLNEKCEKCLCLQACYSTTDLTIKKWEHLRAARERAAWKEAQAIMEKNWKTLYDTFKFPLPFPKPIKPKKAKKGAK